ncbi:helix-turn-helix domain-containing protein [Paenibacillus sp. LMG 31460]|uniref:Helix-turn-helix domain-containing protein n=1 Tax=Paenibacillus germinis TaxID=2654979 RepID=A0ABX1Z8J2_9BACL|nr:AraC family transcriptional regulator [Paenibacillus germinis]NOU88566.1 helix-turn-helix domain-containing protein [Paenibacillus germinis]
MWFKNKKSRKYLRKIYQWIALAMLLPLISFALIAFVKVEQAVLDNEYQANKKILYEVKYNINFMDDMIVNSILSMYYNPEISPLIFNNHVDFTEMLNEMNKIKTSILSVNPFIQSIYLYNRHIKTYYTTQADLLFKDTNFEALLQSKQELPKLKPIPRKIEYNIEKDKKRYENVVTYLMYDFKDELNQPEGALIVNASTEWLLNSIKEINMVDEKRHDQIMILDDNGGIVGHEIEEKGTLQDSLKAIYQQHHSEQASPDNTGYFTEDINDKKYLITYTFVDKMNWTLVKAQLYDEVFQKISTLKYTLIVIIVAFMILAFMASIFISRKIYKPIDTLVKHVVSNVTEMDQSHSKDEISYLNNAYQFSIDQLNQYKLNKQSDREILKTYFLRKLLIDSQSVTKDEFDKAGFESGIGLSQDEPGLVCIVKIDNRAQFEGMFSPFDRDLCTFGIINISLELLSECYRVEVVEMKNDHMAFILNIDGSDKETMVLEITALWNKAQSYISQYFKVSISIFISDRCENLHDLTDKYEVALNNSVYRLLFGKSCVLTNRTIKANTDNSQVGFSVSLEKKLVDSLKSGNVLSAEETLIKLFDEIAKLNYNNVFLSIMGLVNTLKQMTEEINRSRLEPLLINYNLLSNQLFSMETLDEQYDNILQICRSIVTKAERTETDKHSIINNTVIELIQADYANPALCLQYISEKLNVSAKQISKIFNQQYARSVADYINDVRLEKAAEWFGSSNRSIKEVLQKIGVENESYFYKLFKKKYGVTPKEYILNKHVQGTRQVN